MDKGASWGKVDRPHGKYPIHVDLFARTSFGTDQTRVDSDGNIIDQSLNFGNKTEGKGKSFTIKK